MSVSIVSIGEALPSHRIEQKQFADTLADLHALPDSRREWLRTVCERSAIEQRHSVIPDLSGDSAELFHRGGRCPMSRRHAVFAREAPLLAHTSAKHALAHSHIVPDDLTHVIGITCTGVLAPGIEAGLVHSLGLPLDTERLGIHFMGCFGAFKGLATAATIVRENPKAKVLVTCVELCSLHLHQGEENNDLVANAIFGDGSGSAIVTSDLEGWEVVRHCSTLIPDTEHQMTWESDDNHFRMFISAFVPKSIMRHIRPFVDKLRGDIPIEECSFAIHPGGKAVLESVERACGLKKEQTEASWEVLRTVGNISSGTFLFVLNRTGPDYPYAIGLGFGPGLSVEGILLRRRA